MRRSRSQSARFAGTGRRSVDQFSDFSGSKFDKLKRDYGLEFADRIMGNLTVDQGTGDRAVSDGTVEYVREEARRVGLDEDQMVEDVLRTLGIDF